MKEVKGLRQELFWAEEGKSQLLQPYLRETYYVQDGSLAPKTVERRISPEDVKHYQLLQRLDRLTDNVEILGDQFGRVDRFRGNSYES